MGLRRNHRWTIAAISRDQIVTFETFWRIKYVDEAQRQVDRMNASNAKRGVHYVVWDRREGRPYRAPEGGASLHFNR